MAATKVCVAIPTLAVGVFGLIILMQVFVAIRTHLETYFADARRRKMAYRAVIFRHGKVFPVHVDQMEIFVEPPRAVAAVVMAHHAVLNALNA